LRLSQLVGFIGNLTGLTAYPLQFPTNTTLENILVVDIINGTITSSITELNIQIMTRSAYPADAEELGNTVITALHNQTKLLWEDVQVILIQAKSPNPFFNGQDENNNYLYTTDFRLLVTT
jgi:hypothetical protein